MSGSVEMDAVDAVGRRGRYRAEDRDVGGLAQGRVNVAERARRFERASVKNGPNGPLATLSPRGAGATSRTAGAG